jgi:superoxide dismutase, Cu-Zn family
MMGWGPGFRAAPGAPFVAAIVLVVAGCGGDDTRDTTANADGTSPPTMGATAADDARTAREHGARASGRFIDTAGRDVGEVTLEEGADGVMIRGTISGLSPGAHGFHFHETGLCEPPFESAGGHLNPAGRRHGLLAADGPHAGDMPNITADADGNAHFETYAPLVTLAAGADGLLGGAGTALLVHAGADDHRTDPSGNSGDRVACAVLRR